MFGKSIRFQRIKDRKSGRFILLPLDHGVSVGPIDGIANIKSVVKCASNGGATGVILHKGLVQHSFSDTSINTGLIVHLSASTSFSPYPNSKITVCSVEEAIRLGADAVSVHVNLGDLNEREMLAQFGKAAESASIWGLPLLAMVYARGEKIKSSYDPDTIAHCARVAAELGADVVKVSYTGDRESFRNVVDSTPIPVVIAGGEKIDSEEKLLKMVEDSISAGGAGISIGRNIFQARNPRKMLLALGMIVRDHKTSGEAFDFLTNDSAEVE